MIGLSDRQRKAIVIVAVLLVVTSPVTLVAAETFLSSYYPTQGPIHVQADNGLEVVIAGNYNLQSGNPFTPSSFNLSTENNGHMNISSTGSGSVTIDNIEGTWSNASSISTIGTTITMNPIDKPPASVSGDITSIEWRSGMVADDGATDFTYASSLGSGSVTLNGLSASTEYAAIDSSNNAVLDVATSDGAGQVTFNGLDSGSHDAELQTSDGGPTVSNRDPADGANLDSADVTLSADINDPDLPADNVSVEWYVDNSLEATEYIQSNQTVNHQTSLSLGGTHTWRLELEDAYGNTLVTSQFSLETPANLSIRKETAPDQLVDDAEIEITAYYSGEIQRRTTTNGNVSLENFPIDEPIIVRANASGYYTRTAVIEDVFAQNSMYLLNSSNATYLVRFDLRDPTGSFPRDDTVLFVERDLNRSGNVTWQVIAGDNFGVQGIPTNLVQGERYRLRIKNLETGQANVIGSYTAIQSETVVIEAGESSINVPTGDVDYTWDVTKNRTGQYILVEYLDTANQTEEIKVTVHERYNSSNVLVDNDTFTNTNELMYQIPLTNDEANTTWTAVLYIDRGDGFTRFSQPVSGGVQSLIPSELDELWVTAIGVFILLISAMAFSQLNTGTGAVATSLVGGALYLLGVLAPTTTAAAVVIALFVSLVFKYREGT